jgi:hypothetical protein
MSQQRAYGLGTITCAAIIRGSPDETLSAISHATGPASASDKALASGRFQLIGGGIASLAASAFLIGPPIFAAVTSPSSKRWTNRAAASPATVPQGTCRSGAP